MYQPNIILYSCFLLLFPNKLSYFLILLHYITTFCVLFSISYLFSQKHLSLSKNISSSADKLLHHTVKYPLIAPLNKFIYQPRMIVDNEQGGESDPRDL